MDYSYVSLILLLPLFSFLILGLAGMKMSHKTAGLLGTTSLGLVTVLSYVTAFSYFTADRCADGTFATIVPYNFTWLPLGNLNFDLGIMLDPISVMMLIVISTVSFMVHLYSFGYMHGEKGFQRYYAYLSLFTMSMLGLVV
ncbi:MAG: NADH-quinone oxidoreductase subunit L, partial [Prevotella sp.]|nr:NADH-quinone oxidoreductase subunit L [Prevotella sp.]